MEEKTWEKNRKFTDQIMQRHKSAPAERYGARLTYHRLQKESPRISVQKNLYQSLSEFFDRRISQYENKYYQRITGKDRARLVHAVEEIASRPGEKKQLIHLLKGLGVVTREQKEWRESVNRIRRYEEEVTVLRRELRQQEEHLTKVERRESIPISVAEITGAVMENIKREIRMERFRYGMD